MKCKNHTDVEIDEIYESIEETINTTMEKGKFIGYKPITYKDKYLELYDMMIQLLLADTSTCHCEEKEFTDEEWKQITESIEAESCDVDLESLVELWIDTQLDYVRKEGRERALECGYLVEEENKK